MLIVVVAVVFMLELIFAWLPAILGRLGGCHALPDMPYSTEEAHSVMQWLIDCDMATCAAKHAAFWTLVDAKRVTPVAGAVR
jgi:hypothetical protein